MKVLTCASWLDAVPKMKMVWTLEFAQVDRMDFLNPKLSFDHEDWQTTKTFDSFSFLKVLFNFLHKFITSQM